MPSPILVKIPELDPISAGVIDAAADLLVLIDVSDVTRDALGTAKSTTIADIATKISHSWLSGIVANEHVDHSGVSITAGTGLSGGGTIAATRTLNLSLTGLSAITTIESADLLAVSTDSDGTPKKITWTNFLVEVATDVTLIPLSGLATIPGCSVVAKSSSAAGVPSTITASDGGVLRRTGSTLDFGAILLNDSNSVTNTLQAGNGGTGFASYTAGDILYATGATTLTKLAKGTALQQLRMNAGETAPEWGPAADPIAPYNVGNITGTVTLDYANGKFQKAALTGTTTLAVPSNGTEGTILKLWLTSSGAARDLSMNASIKIPDESLLSWPKTLTSGKKYIAMMVHDGTNWLLTSFVGGY